MPLRILDQYVSLNLVLIGVYTKHIDVGFFFKRKKMGTEIFTITNIIITLSGVLSCFFISKILDKSSASSLLSNAKNEADRIIKSSEIEGENLKKDKIFQAKEKFLELKSQHEKHILDREKELNDTQKKIKDKETQISNQLELNKKNNQSLTDRVNSFNKKIELFDKKNNQIEKIHKEQIEKLEKISSLSASDAKKELLETLVQETKTEALELTQNIIEEAKLSARQDAKKIVINTIQRVGTEEAIDNCVSVFNIESDDLKGRIIGREGRNIRAIESATGVEIIVDDTPEAIILSCFDSVRREIARLSLHKLVTDGRIHPARIEEVVKKTSKEIENEIIEVGKRTVIDLGIHGLNPALIKAVGRMKYRSSYGQNLLHHSREVAKLCGIMCSELGLNSKLAKRAGLLHDIGKVPEEEIETPHALLGMQWAEKYGENPEVCNAIGAHHDEIEMNNLISPIVQVCDAISGARPGARRQVLDSYIQRLKEMEDIAYDFKGVNKAYAIQAGRELRVMVESDKISDEQAAKLSYQISQKIQTDMTYPGQVKVTVIRETRAVNIAT